MGFRRSTALKLVPVVRFFASAFYPQKYLRGPYFDSGLSGWRWVFLGILFQKILGFNRNVPWPASPFLRINGPPGNMVFDPQDLAMFNTFGCYYQCFGATITIGEGTWIAPNVGLITTNHDTNNLWNHRPGRPIVIGPRCWIGMNSVILPGVTLGPRTIVGAGTVVTKSFPDGHCTVAGVPAVMVKREVHDAEGAIGTSSGAAHRDQEKLKLTGK